MHQKTFILRNNKDITIEGKSIFWKAWFDKGIHFVQDLLNKNGIFLSRSELMMTTEIQFFAIAAN